MAQAYERDGDRGLDARVAQFERELRSVMLLSGAANIAALRDPEIHVIAGPLATWMHARGIVPTERPAR